MVQRPEHLTIIGGGPAGLAAGYYASQEKFPFTIYESRERVGGNAVTLQHGPFLFDSGAHRFHDQDPAVTADVKALLGDRLERIEVPSQIFHHGKFIDFPLSPLQLLLKLGPVECGKAALKLLQARLWARQARTFEDLAIHTYGRTIAEHFLLNYSEKLWGLPCHRLSPRVAGRRMKGLTLATFFLEAMFSRKAKTEHLDGSFYYPRRGIGEIVDHLAQSCGSANIHTGARVTGVGQAETSITSIEINGEQHIEVDEVISTLPMSDLLALIAPPPPAEILALAGRLRFRNLVLVAIFLDADAVTPNGSVYFPEPDFVFTRVYEPRNRSRYLAPSGKTSLVAEIPCNGDDEIWNAADVRLVERVCSEFSRIGWNVAKTIDTQVVRIDNTYPILELGFEQTVDELLGFLAGFDNLQICGRNGRFLYTHLHDQMRSAKDLINGYVT